MFLRYTFDSPIVRDEDHGFIRHYDVDVFGFGEEVDFEARPEHEEWVLKEWET